MSSILPRAKVHQPGLDSGKPQPLSHSADLLSSEVADSWFHGARLTRSVVSFSTLDRKRLLAADAELRSLARRLVDDVQHGEDAVQDVWLAVLRDQVRPDDTPGSRLKRALKFRVWSARRGDSRRRAREDATARKPKTETSPADLVRAQEVRQRVVDAVVGLREPHRRTVMLRFFEGLSPAATAQRMGVPVETVRTRTRRALELLRARLGQEFGGRAAWVLPVATLSVDRSSPLAVHKILNGVLSVNAKAKTVAIVAASIASVLIIAFLCVTLMNQSDDSSPDEGARSVGAGDIGTPSGKTKDGEGIPTRSFASLGPGRDADEAPSAGKQAVPLVGTLRVKVVDGESGAPVKGILVRFQPLNVPDPFQHFRNHLTDQQGVILLESWPVGATRVQCILGDMARVTVEADATTEKILTIEKGLSIRGLVTTENGSPIPGAEVVVGRIASQYEGHPVATTDANGAFTLSRFVPDGGRAIGVRAEGFVASRVVIVQAQRKLPDVLEFVLKAPDSSLSFTVVDPTGAPLENAVVVVGKQDLQFGRADIERTGTGLLTVGPFAVALRTDARGQTTVGCLPAGKTTVRIRHQDYVPWMQEIQLGTGSTVHRRVQLANGFTVRGTVRTQTGEPVPSCAVRIGRLGPAGGHLARTDAKGGFVLHDVPAGRHKIFASKHKVGETDSVVDVGLGQENAVALVLTAGPSILGVVVDEEGNPLSGLRIDADVRFFTRASAVSNAAGRFEILDLEEGKEYRLAVVSKKGVTIFIHPTPVLPGEDEWRVTVPSAQLAESSVRGAVVGPDAAPIEGAAVSVNISRGGDIASLEAKTDDLGRFVVAGLTPGNYTLGIGATGFARKSVRFQVVSGEDVDLGTITFPMPGRIEYHARNPDGLSQRGLGAYTRRKDARGSGWTDLSRTPIQSNLMEPGRYHVSIRSPEVAMRGMLVEVKPGETTPVTFDVSAGVAWSVAFGESFVPEGGTVRVAVSDAGETLLYDQAVSLSMLPDRKLKLRLPEGAHVLVITMPDGSRIQRSLESSAETATVWIE